MKEYTTTFHAYQVDTPPRCKLARLVPVVEEITLPLHFAESAPVAMRAARPLTYTGKDGAEAVYSEETLELFALDGLLWKKSRNDYKAGQWTIEDLADMCDEHKFLKRWAYQYGNDEPPTDLLFRDCGTWATVDEVRAGLMKRVDNHAIIGGCLFDRAKELVYAYTKAEKRGRGLFSNYVDGHLVIATEYLGATPNLFPWGVTPLCNALQNWREVNPYGEHAAVLLDHVTGADSIEVLLPEYVKADPHADFLRASIEKCERRAVEKKDEEKSYKEQARKLRECAKAAREASASACAEASEYAAQLAAYLQAEEA